MSRFKRAICVLTILSICNPVYARGGGGFGGGGHSFSSGSHSFGGGSHSFGGGSHSFSSGSHSFSSGSSSFGRSSTGSSYSGGRSSFSSGGHSFSSGSSSSSSSFGRSSMPRGDFNSGLTQAGQHESSRITYQRGQASLPTYRTPKGTTKSVSASEAPHVDKVRSYVTHERYITYDNRASVFYHGYAPTSYNDCWSPFLMGYLFSSAINSHDRAEWVYNHRDSIDDARYRDLVSKDAKLEAELKQIQEQKKAADPNYTLPGMTDPDLQYNKDFVTAAYNPQASDSEVYAEDEGSGGSFPAIPTWVIWTGVALLVVVLAACALNTDV